MPGAFEWVDVRDVAKAFAKALTLKKANGERYILCNSQLLHADLAKLIRAVYGPKGYQVPSTVAPKWLLRIVALFDEVIRDFAMSAVDGTVFVDTQRTQRELGLVYIPIHESVVDTCDSLISHGLAMKPKPQSICGALLSTFFKAIIVLIVSFIVGFLIGQGIHS